MYWDILNCNSVRFSAFDCAKSCCYRFSISLLAFLHISFPLKTFSLRNRNFWWEKDFVTYPKLLMWYCYCAQMSADLAIIITLWIVFSCCITMGNWKGIDILSQHFLSFVLMRVRNIYSFHIIKGIAYSSWWIGNGMQYSCPKRKAFFCAFQKMICLKKRHNLMLHV